MPVNYVINSLWTWIATKGLTLCILVCIAFLIPRIGRLIVRWVTIDMDRREHAKATQAGKDLVVDSESRKGRLALLGAVVYIVEAIAFFFVAIHILKQFGFSTSGAAIPATAVSAALAFGAQKIIADFLAGFFIITERQFGVGDWVVFNTAAGPIEGEVTAVTLRATTVRTVSGEEATVANSVPSSCINTSSGWSRAIIDMPIPISAADNTEQLTTLFDSCVAKTLSSPSLARLVSTDDGAVKILPATKLISPTSAGVPWCLNYRVIIQVEPGEQWVVERAVRAAVMNEMWAAYTDSTMDSFVEIPGVTTDLSGHPNPAATAHTVKIPTPDKPDTVEEIIKPAVEAAHTADEDDTPTQVIPQAGTKGEQKQDKKQEKEEKEDKEAKEDDSKKSALEKEAEDALTRGLWRKDHHSSALARILSVGGRCRPSTMALLLALFVLIILRGLSLDGGDQGVGILAPTSSQSSNQSNSGATGAGTGESVPTQEQQTPTTQDAAPTTAPAPEKSSSGSQGQSDSSSQSNSAPHNAPSYSWNSGSGESGSSAQGGSGSDSGESASTPTTGVATPTTAPQSSANRSGAPATNAAGPLE